MLWLFMGLHEKSLWKLKREYAMNTQKVEREIALHEFLRVKCFGVMPES